MDGVHKPVGGFGWIMYSQFIIRPY